MKSEWINTMLVSVANNAGMESLFIIIGKSFLYRRESKCPTMFNFRQVRKGNAVVVYCVCIFFDVCYPGKDYIILPVIP